jgi:hypothetical protein
VTAVYRTMLRVLTSWRMEASTIVEQDLRQHGSYEVLCPWRVFQRRVWLFLRSLAYDACDGESIIPKLRLSSVDTALVHEGGGGADARK